MYNIDKKLYTSSRFAKLRAVSKLSIFFTHPVYEIKNLFYYFTYPPLKLNVFDTTGSRSPHNAHQTNAKKEEKLN